MKKNKFLILVLLFLLNVSCQEQKQCKSCFNSENFDKVYNKICSNNNSIFYNEYQLIYNAENEIDVNKKGRLIGRIRKDKGIYSTNILRSQNRKNVNEIECVFCKVLNKR